jgi:hypothetical protein
LSGIAIFGIFRVGAKLFNAKYDEIMFSNVRFEGRKRLRAQKRSTTISHPFTSGGRSLTAVLGLPSLFFPTRYREIRH